jgi:hypothetical protein
MEVCKLPEVLKPGMNPNRRRREPLFNISRGSELWYSEGTKASFTLG